MIINLLFFVSFAFLILVYNAVEDKQSKEYIKLLILMLIVIFLW